VGEGPAGRTVSRNAKILVHRCFDPSRLEYESDLFVRFPKADCTCTERVRVTERNAMLAEGRAVVVLRDGVLPSTDKFQWKEIVVIFSRNQYKRVPTARTISEFDIYRAYH
jgi:hypothetical protein